VASPAAGTCGNPGDPRARKTVSVSASQPVAYAIMDLDAQTGSRVFVIDDFSFTTTSLSLTSTYPVTPPSIDGSIGIGEWSMANTLPFDHGFITAYNDDHRLYLLVDATGDTGNDPSGDYFWLSFDVDKNQAITPNVDINYGLVNGNMRYQYYLGPGSWTGTQPDTLSSRGKGFGCFFADGTLTFTWRIGIKCTSHRVWELGIDLAEIGASPGDTLGMGLRVASATPSFIDQMPANFQNDFSNLIQVELAGPMTSLVPTKGSIISLESNPIEVTQAIQTRTNSMPLVQDKRTAARVYVDVNGPVGAQNSIVYLYGSKAGLDLPGSPLAMISSAPTTIDRDDLDDTANFLLPKSWTQGSVTFKARAATSRGIEDTSGSIPLTFTPKETPTYWVVPINTGTDTAPVLPNNNDINDHQNYLKSAFPVPNVTFVRRDWTAIGPNAPGGSSLIQELNDYHGVVVLGWILSVLFSGEAPYDLPDQVYGFTPFGGGLSDPAWYNSGNAYVAWGGDASVTGNGTMAHEINHNLDPSSTGTWGRHNGGCGSSGPDSAWPYGNDDINEVGFDTRLPWQATFARRTVSPANTPDFMSYCGSGTLPSNWISPYRWQALFNTFSSTTQARMMAQTNMIESVFYISAQLHRDGTGNLDPVLVQPGIPQTVPSPSAEKKYAVDVYNSSNNLLVTIPIMAVFEDLEGDPIDTVYFNFSLAEQQDAARFVLRGPGGDLDEIVVSRSAPTVRLLSPNDGESWSGDQTIKWTAADSDQETLEFTLLYTPDDGKNWYPIDKGVSGDSYEVDTAGLPGSTDARIRIIATDGFNTVEDDSDELFSLVEKDPVVTIQSPTNLMSASSNETINFSGDAFDAEDGALPDGAFVWSDNGVYFGQGREVQAQLEPGFHVVTLEVADSAENIGESTVMMLIDGDSLYLPFITKGTQSAVFSGE
jgi:hypothetical protein